MTETRRDGVDVERRWAATPVGQVLSDWATSISEYAGDAGRPDPAGTIVFGAGIPDAASLPMEGLLAAARRVLEKDGEGALRYGGAQGDLVMRQWLADRLNAQEDAGVGPENFLLTNGSGQAIQMVMAGFLNPGDTVLVERPSYSGGMRVIRAYGAEMAGVDMDDEGVLVEQLDETVERLVAAGRTPKLFYTMPTLHNPTGITTMVARRESVVEICDRHGILIVEDDAYGEVRVDGVRPPSYFKLAGGEGALRLSTVSKMLATGLRVGWVTGRKDFIDALTRLRFDGGLSPFLIRTVAEFCTSGDEDRHLAGMIPIYREKRDRMLSALSERCARYGTWTQPQGGFFIWMTLAESVDPDKLAAAMQDERVAARPGTMFFPDSESANYLRLCFSTPTVADIEEGIQRLGRALDRSTTR
ncbi:MAG: PLP-dependent aminotransferase family protein [Chloroflexi bacterium]|nr:PLP-dependent aminotransferase family protein [Chloroflexota bacterium]